MHNKRILRARISGMPVRDQLLSGRWALARRKSASRYVSRNTMTMDNQPSSSISTDQSGRSKLTYVVRSVFLTAWPLALVFATFEFFPFEMHNPLNHPNPFAYVVIWTFIGVVVGLFNWNRFGKDSTS